MTTKFNATGLSQLCDLLITACVEVERAEATLAVRKGEYRQILAELEVRKLNFMIGK